LRINKDKAAAVKKTPENARDGNTGRRGIRRLIAATGDSLSGLASAWRSEEAFRLEVILAVFLLPAALWIGSTAMERFLLVGTIILVMIVELLNTAVEYTVDRIGTDHHHLSGGAKDLASAAVFLSVLLASGVWGLSIWNRFFSS
jgi:diacylglycerol kinase (ATP)